MKKIVPSVINTSNNKEFKCLHEDAKLLLNMLDQSTRPGIKKTDYIQPGILAGQTKMDIVKITAQSILNHIKNFEERYEFFY